MLCAQVLEIISYVTIISGQSMEKLQKVSYMRAIPQGNDLTTSILHLALPSEVFHKQVEPISILITAAFRSNTARSLFFQFLQKHSSEKITTLKLETTLLKVLKEPASLINVLSVRQSLHFHTQPKWGPNCQLSVSTYSLRSMAFCTEIKQIQAGHWCPIKEKGFYPVGFSDF